ncbi:MAG: EAL domain-containing protein [Micavibrio sp.]|nr:EAL domain-containing protein [Micavibrio sp.]
MRRDTIFRRSILWGVVSVLLSLFLCVCFSWYKGRLNAVAALSATTAEVVQRATESRHQMDSALQEMAAGKEAPCSAKAMSRMRDVAAVKDYLQGLGYVEDNRLMCSTVSETGQTVDLGAPSPVQLSGFRGWYQRPLPGIPGHLFNFVGRQGKGNVAIVLPELVLDVPLPASGVSLVQVSYGGRVIRARGVYKPEWLQWKPQGEADRQMEDALLFARTVPQTGQTIYGAMPLSEVRGFLWQAFWRSLPLAVMVMVLLLVLIGLIAREKLSLRSQIKTALRLREFYLLYQPVIDLQRGTCVGAEALIRWKRSDGSMVSPVEFIPVAEQHGLIEQVTTQVMEMVAEDAVPLIRDHPETHIAINFSPEDLESVFLEERLQRLIRSVGASNNIVIEATERGLLFPEKVADTLISVRAKGLRVGIDDFGTGNSSLSYLGTYDLDFLKIDKSFVDALGKDESTSQVAFHIIGLAHSLGLKIVAEGVETKKQEEILRDAGVQYAQGWIFAKPMSMSSLAEFVRAQNA